MDLWPLYLLVNEAYVVNFSIDIYTQVEIREKKDASIDLEFSSLSFKSFKKSFSHFKVLENKVRERDFSLVGEDTERVKISLEDSILSFLWPHLRFWNPRSGFSLKASSQSPVGGGIGGSSSLCMSLIKAFSQWLKREMSLEQMVSLASNIEAKILGFPTGTQDYFPAFKEGFYVIRYDVEGFHLTSFSKGWQEVFSENMLLIETGKPHHSGQLNWRVYQSALQKKQKTLQALKDLSRLSEKISNLCIQKKWDLLPEHLNQELAFRLCLDKAFVPPHIQQLKEELMSLGAEAFKVCGAGGGGSVFVWASKKKARDQIFDFCRRKGLKLLKAKPI